MKLDLKSVLISGFVALTTSAAGFYSALLNIEDQQDVWITEIQTKRQETLFKERLTLYPDLFKILKKLSSLEKDSLNGNDYLLIAHSLNNWFYNSGGLSASFNTLTAFEKLKVACASPNKTTEDLKQIYDYKNVLIYFMRWDLNLKAYNPYGEIQSTSLEKLINETQILKDSNPSILR